MKNIIILAGLTHNQPSPTGKIANRFFEILSQDFNVKVLYVANSPRNTEKIPQNYIPIKDPLFNFVYNHKGKKRVIIYFLIRLLRKISFLFNKQIPLGWYKNEAILALDKIKKEINIDLMISFSSPFITHITAKEFCEVDNLPWLAVTIDPLYQSVQRISGKNLNFEKKIYESANLNFFTKDLINTKLKSYTNHLIKYEELPYEIPNNTFKNQKSNSKEINLIYQGSFYKKIREPHFMLNVLSLLPQNYKISIYTKGSYEKLVKLYSKRYPNIVFKGYVSSEEIKIALKEADGFINVSNSIEDFMPSKTFEYISYGKLIINFSNNKFSNQILEKYRLHLNISQLEINPNEASKKICEFIDEHITERISYEEIDRIYCLNSFANFEDRILQKTKEAMIN